MRIEAAMCSLFERQWKPDQNARAAPRFGGDLESSADQENALAHELQPEPPGVESRLRNEARALVCDLDERLSAGAPRSHPLRRPARGQPAIGGGLLEQSVDSNPDRK